jgi:hypothetical protein
MLVTARRPSSGQATTGQASTGQASISSLAAVRNGDRVRIHTILFDAARQYCEDLGFAVGDVVCCRNAGRSSLLLVNPDGRTVSLDRDWARFIQVRAVSA